MIAKGYKCFLLFVFLFILLASCVRPLIGQEADKVKEGLARKNTSLNMEYEYSYIQPKDYVIDVKEGKDQTTVYVSLGAPSLQKGWKNAMTSISENDGKVYIANVFDGVHSTKFELEYPPFFLEVANNKAIYVTENKAETVFVEDMKTGKYYTPIINLSSDVGTKSNSDETFSLPLSFVCLLVNEHFFYINTDGYLERCTFNGSEHTIIVKDKIFNIKYNEGWIYYIDSKNRLCRVGADGCSKELVAQDGVIDYCFADSSIFYISSNSQVDISESQIRNIKSNITQTIMNCPNALFILGYDNGFLYTDNLDLFFKSNINSKIMEVFVSDFYNFQYAPILLDGWIYYYRLADPGLTPAVSELVRRNIGSNETEVIGGPFQEVVTLY